MFLLAVAPLSIGFVALGLGAAGTLFALHHLRVQPTRQPIATTMFWRAAVRPQQTRVPWSRRFTHRRTFALLATILLLTAAALTADRWGNLVGPDRRDVLVVDTGVAMGADDGTGHSMLMLATAAARADVGRLSPGTALIAAGPEPLVLSGGDEPAAVVRRRLDLIAPGAGASASALALQLARGVQGTLAGDIYWYTAKDQIPAGLPYDVATRVHLHHIAPASAVSIVGVTFQPSANDPTQGTLTVRCAGKSNRPMTLSAEIDGEAATTQPATDLSKVTFVGLPADGRSVTVRLIDAPGPTSTHETSIRLPDERPLTFRFFGDVPSTLRAAALSLGTESNVGRIVIAGPGVAVPADTAAVIAIVDQGISIPTGARLAFPASAARARGLSLEDGTADGPALTTPGEPVLIAGSATVMSLDRTTRRRTLYISQGLINSTADLPRRAAFPVLLGRLCRELVGRSSAAVAVAALRTAQDPLWAGPPESPASAEAPVSLPDAPPMAMAAIASGTPIVLGNWYLSWTEVVLGVALALTVVEAFLLAARKIV